MRARLVSGLSPTLTASGKIWTHWDTFVGVYSLCLGTLAQSGDVDGQYAAEGAACDTPLSTSR